MSSPLTFYVFFRGRNSVIKNFIINLFLQIVGIFTISFQNQFFRIFDLILKMGKRVHFKHFITFLLHRISLVHIYSDTRIYLETSNQTPKQIVIVNFR